jgi:hypothetical protein
VAEVPQALAAFEMQMMWVSLMQMMMMWPVLKPIPLQRSPLKKIEILKPHPFAQKPEPDPEP